MLPFLAFLRVLKYHNEIISIGFVVGADVVLHLLLRRLNFFFVHVCFVVGVFLLYYFSSLFFIIKRGTKLIYMGNRK